MARKKQINTDFMAERRKVVFSAMMGVCLFSFFVNLLMLTVPLYMLQIFDRVLSSRSVETLLILSLATGVALLAMGGLDGARSAILARTGFWMKKRFGGPLLLGSVVARFTQGEAASSQSLRDLDTLRSFLTGGGMLPLVDAPWTPIMLAVIFLLHPVLGSMAIAGALLLFMMSLVNELSTRRLIERSNLGQIAAMHDADYCLRNADAIEAMGMAPNLIRRWNARNVDVLSDAAAAVSRGLVITSVSKFMRFSLQAGILGLGAWLVIGDELTPGGMIAASILMSRALAPVEMAIGGWKNMVVARDAYRRVGVALAAVPPRGQAMPLPVPSSRVEAHSITFFYPGDRTPTLKNISFELSPATILAVIGPSASGKTTLARLLVGNLIPAMGAARLDGVDLAHWDPDDRGRHVGYLPQDVELFPGTLRDNISRLERGEPEAVIEAARVAGVHDMILRLPNGYDTEIGGGALVLSGGQRQRIGLARSVYATPPLVVLDEPNSSLDGAGEAALHHGIAAMKQRGSTVIVVSHRASTLRQADKILLLQDGVVRIFGDRDEVLAQMTPKSQLPPSAAGQTTHG